VYSGLGSGWKAKIVYKGLNQHTSPITFTSPTTAFNFWRTCYFDDWLGSCWITMHDVLNRSTSHLVVLCCEARNVVHKAAPIFPNWSIVDQDAGGASPPVFRTQSILELQIRTSFNGKVSYPIWNKKQIQQSNQYYWLLNRSHIITQSQLYRCYKIHPMY
jgi:hypothetical protein